MGQVNNENPTVSVVMSAYNEEEAIAESIKSILGQAYDDLELIIVDDSSSDSTVEIINSIEDDRMKLIQNKQNIGLAKSLNKGISASSGEYIARMDADEYSKRNRIEQQKNYLNNNNEVVVVGCWYDIIGKDGQKILTEKISKHRSFTVEDIMKNGPGIAHGSVMMRRDEVKVVGRYREQFRYAQDYDLWLRIADYFGGGAIDFISESLYERKISPDQIVTRKQTLICAEYANKIIRTNETEEAQLLDELEESLSNTNSRELTKSEQKSMYYYLISMRYLNNDMKFDLYKNIFRSIIYNPLMIRPWYQLVSSIMPSSIEQKFKHSLRKHLYRPKE